jgi:hypothetical protein
MFPLQFDNEIKIVSKIKADDFTPLHREILGQIRYEENKLVLPNEKWRSIFLGAGEEKAVYCICDQNNRVFALEVLDEKTYLNGRFVGGEYFFDMTLPGLRNVKADSASLVGLTFTGKVKIREFVYGYVWERFQFSPQKTSVLDSFLTSYLQTVFSSKFNEYRSHYKDVHERNLMFEIRDIGAKGTPAIAKDWMGKVKIVKVGLQPIDVR